MSGTSMDAIDTALVSFQNDKPELVAYKQFPIDEQLRATLRTLDTSSTIEEVSNLDARMGHLFADSVLKILNVANIDADRVAAIGNHGQTILHLPDAPFPRTLQIGDPNIIANKCKITTVGDFRRMDIADGGQGAPLAPAFHAQVFRREGVNRIILNLGGIANITILPGDTDRDISGFDTGPGNGLLDDWNQRHRRTDMDRDSAWAHTGQVSEELGSLLLADPYFNLMPPKSSGRDYFHLKWLNKYLSAIETELRPEDIQATLLQLTVTTVSEAIKQHAPEVAEVYICGGGAQNERMMQALSNSLPNIHLGDTHELGLDPDAIEAVSFAWLAKQTFEHKVGNEPGVTGANSVQILGGMYQAIKE